MGHHAHTCSIRKFINGKEKKKYVLVLRTKLILVELTLMDPSLNGYQNLALHLMYISLKEEDKGNLDGEITSA